MVDPARESFARAGPQGGMSPVMTSDMAVRWPCDYRLKQSRRARPGPGGSPAAPSLLVGDPGERVGAGSNHSASIRATRTRTPVRALAVAAVLSATGPLLGGTAAAQDGEFRNGEASASADTFTLNVKQGNANIGFTYGRAMADYRDRTASAEARALDLGVLPTLLAVDPCDGSAPPMNPDTLPAITRTESTEPASVTSRRTEIFVPGYFGGPHGESAGFQDATASGQPASRAVTESSDADVFLLTLVGGTTEVSTRLEGRVREARAVSRAEELRVFGGLFTFTQPRWEAVARSGDVELTEGSFTFERASVLGIQRTKEEALADFAEFEYGLEQLLAPLGVRLDLPTVEVHDGRVQVSPMAFRVVDPPFGAQVLAPFLGSIQPLREAAVRDAVAADCKNALAITILDIVLGVAAGSGSIEILAGGVDVSTADTDFSVPPLDLLPPLDSPPMEVPPLDTGGAQVLGSSTVPDPAPTEVAAPRKAPPPTPRRAAALVPTTVTRFEDGRAGKAAVAVGSAGLVGAVALSLGERLRLRVASRRSS